MQKPDWIQSEDFEKLSDICFEKAKILKVKGIKPTCDMDIFELTDLLITLELEKIEKNISADCLIGYDDEVVSIEPVGPVTTVDITVTGDNLFYCNGLLTKNSIGLPATLDLFLALIRTDELEAEKKLMIKQLKNRWGDISENQKFVVGVDRSKMKVYNLDDPIDQGYTRFSPKSEDQNTSDDDNIPFGNKFGKGRKGRTLNVN